jgi:hypothetical protein
MVAYSFVVVQTKCIEELCRYQSSMFDTLSLGTGLELRILSYVDEEGSTIYRVLDYDVEELYLESFKGLASNAHS